jgi:hypothetical protein
VVAASVFTVLVVDADALLCLLTFLPRIWSISASISISSIVSRFLETFEIGSG